MHLDGIDLLTSLFGMKFNLELHDQIIIKKDWLFEYLLPTTLPLEICLVSSSSMQLVIDLKHID